MYTITQGMQRVSILSHCFHFPPLHLCDTRQPGSSDVCYDRIRLTSQRPNKIRSLLITRAISNVTSGSTTLRNPARLAQATTATVSIPTFSSTSGQPSLDEYMRLPPEAYAVLDEKLIEPLGGNRFRLHVPRISLFSVFIEPVVDVCVLHPKCDATSNQSMDKVILTSESCRIRGSDVVQRMKLDERFALQFTTTLTWHENTISNALSSSSSSTTLNNSSISGDLELEVLTEVIPPFHLIPRRVLESTGNTVLRVLIHSLLPVFLNRLALDYVKWATDPSYREIKHKTSSSSID